MKTGTALLRALRAPAGAAVAAAASRWDCRLPARAEERFQELPAKVAMQGHRPAVPYPGWDDNWDYCDLDAKAVAKRLKHEWPIGDYPEAIHRLYADHANRALPKVDKLIEANRDDLPGLYKRAFLQHAYGGGVTRHIILVRHGQYEEQRELARQLHSENPHHFGLPGDTRHQELDRARVLTALGRLQAERVGDRLAQLLEPALTTPGRESHVRIHVSTLSRAKETADVIASRLPPHVRRLEPNPMLIEGDPPAHIIPYQARGGEDFLFDRARDVHVEGARMEAAFRSLFYRDLPSRPPRRNGEKEAVKGGSGASPDAEAGYYKGGRGDEAAGPTDAEKEVDTGGKKAKPLPRHEYEVVVCHMNVIRYFTLRALQLPPEAWLRLGGDNGSITHLKIRPSGSVSLCSFGDSGHMPLEEITFGMHQGLE